MPQHGFSKTARRDVNLNFDSFVLLFKLCFLTSCTGVKEKKIKMKVRKTNAENEQIAHATFT